MYLPDRLVLGRRSKACLIAVLVALVLLIAQPARADDDEHWILRMVCAPYSPGSTMWTLLGCYQLPDDPGRARAD